MRSDVPAGILEELQRSRVYRRFFNDIGALKAAGLSACVKNAPQEVKDCCDMVLSDCMDGAVAEFIERVQKII
ncbi:MAG: HAD family hydrolase [Gallintestinimicrobium sp.]